MMLRDFAEEIGIAARHRDVVQRAYAPGCVEADRDEKAAPGISDFLERHVHSIFVTAVIFRPKQPLRRIGADHKRRAWKQARLFDKGGRSREFDRRPQANCASRCLTVSPAKGGLSTFVTESSKATGCCRSSSAARASDTCPSWIGLNEPGNSTSGCGADSIICPSGWTVTRSTSPAKS